MGSRVTVAAARAIAWRRVGCRGATRRARGRRRWRGVRVGGSGRLGLGLDARARATRTRFNPIAPTTSGLVTPTAQPALIGARATATRPPHAATADRHTGHATDRYHRTWYATSRMQYAYAVACVTRPQAQRNQSWRRVIATFS